MRLGQCGARHFDACFRARAYAEPHAARWRTRQRFVQPRPRGSRDSLQLCRCDRPWVCHPQSVNLAGSLSGDDSLRFGADASRAPKSIACEARSGRRYVDARRVLRRLPQKSLSRKKSAVLASFDLYRVYDSVCLPRRGWYRGKGSGRKAASARGCFAQGPGFYPPPDETILARSSGAMCSRRTQRADTAWIPDSHGSNPRSCNAPATIPCVCTSPPNEFRADGT